MTQVARPASDVSNVNWSPTPLFAHIGTPTPDDPSPISTPGVPGGIFEVLLSPLARPITGTHTLTVRFEQTAPFPTLVTFALLQGGQTIAARSVQATGAFGNYDLVLMEQEIDLISDYNNLHLRVLVGGGGSGSGSGGSGAWGSVVGSVAGSAVGSAPGSAAPGSLVSGSGGSMFSGTPAGSVSGSRPSGSQSGVVSGSHGSMAASGGSAAKGSPGSTSGPGSQGVTSGVSGSKGSASGVSGPTGSKGSASGQSGSSGSSGSGSSGIRTVSGCNQCPNGAARQFTFTFSGVTNAACTTCNNANTTFGVVFSGGCTWQSAYATICNSGVTAWQLVIAGTVTLTLPGNGGFNIVQYRATFGNWDCKSPLVLSAPSVSSDCTNWPATVTITPV